MYTSSHGQMRATCPGLLAHPNLYARFLLLLQSTVSGEFVFTAAATAGWDRCHRLLDCQSLPLAGVCCHVLLDCQSLQLTGFSFHPRESLPLTGGGGPSYHFLYIDCFSSVHGLPFQSPPLRDQSLSSRWPFPPWSQPPPLAFPYERIAKGRDDNYNYEP